MKGLDTPVLLAILHGDRNVKALLRRLRGVEVATTELNLLELQSLAGRGPPKGRLHRREALDSLRRAVTVLPFDSKAAERAVRRAAKDHLVGVSPLLLATLATLEANGCDELITTQVGAIPGRWQFRVTKLAASNV